MERLTVCAEGGIVEAKSEVVAEGMFRGGGEMESSNVINIDNHSQVTVQVDILLSPQSCI